MTYDPKSQMFAKIILASQHPDGTPLYTVHMRYPRPIHGEVMTHREFSRNARSSRAVPVKTMLEEVRNTPYIPWYFGANQKGMQAGAEHNELVLFDHFLPGPLSKSSPQGFVKENVGRTREGAWLHARDEALRVAEAMMEAGYHKQIVNRLLEPFSWIDTLVTTTSFSNFLWLREHKDAEPHLQDLAHMVAEAIQAAGLEILEPDEWHLPYVDAGEYYEVRSFLDERSNVGPPDHDMVKGALKKISAARCARISYTPFDGGSALDHKRELERYNTLVTSERVHASPLEHQATPDDWWEDASGLHWEQPHLHGNLPGWCQFRKTIPGEYHA